MAVTASCLISIAESSLAVMADGTLKHLGLAPRCFKDVIVTLSAFDLLLGDVSPMAEGYTARASECIIRDVPAVWFILLSMA